jgi:hypothetical protein
MNDNQLQDEFQKVKRLTFGLWITMMVALLMLFILVGCVPRAERVLFKVNTDTNYKYKLQAQKEFEGCRTLAEAKVRVLKDMGITAITVHGYARDKYAWDHMVCKAYLDGEYYALDSLDPVVWEWEAWKQANYDYKFE